MNKDHWIPHSEITEEDEAAIRHMKEGEYKILSS